jgi:hypothetical protein
MLSKGATASVVNGIAAPVRPVMALPRVMPAPVVWVISPSPWSGDGLAIKRSMLAAEGAVVVGLKATVSVLRQRYRRLIAYSGSGTTTTASSRGGKPAHTRGRARLGDPLPRAVVFAGE